MGFTAARANEGPSAWLSAACASPGQGEPRLQRRAADGRRAALVEAAWGAGVASHVLVAPSGHADWQDMAVFEGRVEAMEWQGEELLLAIASETSMRVFSVCPGIRLRDASGPGGLHWLRLSTRRARR